MPNPPKAGAQPVAGDFLPPAYVAELYEKSKGQEFDISSEVFGTILQEICARYLQKNATERERKEFCAGLRLEELALARACAAGHDRAWESFLIRYREKLYGMASNIAKEASAARELADSLYADLYGTTSREGQRVSKLASYTGRGSLEGWLRTVLAQEHINRYRKQRRLISLDEETDEGAQFAAPEAPPEAVVDVRVEAATDEVLAALPGDDRFILAAYFLDDRTLADIARALGVHESTISRKVDKLAKSLRKQILAALGRRGMSRRQAQEAMDVDVRDMRLNIRARLMQEPATTTFTSKEEKAPAEGSSS